MYIFHLFSMKIYVVACLVETIEKVFFLKERMRIVVHLSKLKCETNIIAILSERKQIRDKKLNNIFFQNKYSISLRRFVKRIKLRNKTEGG